LIHCLLGSALYGVIVAKVVVVPLGTWLYRVTVNIALNRRRSLAASVEVAFDDQRPTFLADGRRAGDHSFLLADGDAGGRVAGRGSGSSA